MRYEHEIVGKNVSKVISWDEVPEEPEVVSPGKSAVTLIRDIAIALVIIIVILQFVKPTIVFEHSMEDTLHPEDYVFLSKKAYAFGEIQHGDIVVCESVLVDERGVAKNLIKRVIGMPGDTIAIKDGAVYRNGERLDEPYTKDGVTKGESAEIVVPEGWYYLLGDNRDVSMDSRSEKIGFISEDKIRGKVFFRLFPISSAGWVH